MLECHSYSLREPFVGVPNQPNFAKVARGETAWDGCQSLGEAQIGAAGFSLLNFLDRNFRLFLHLVIGEACRLAGTPIKQTAVGTTIVNCQLSIAYCLYGSVFQWIEFQIPILKMQVRFLPGLQQNNQKKSKPLNLNGLAVFVFRAYPFCSSEVKCVVRDSGDFGKRKFSLPRSGLTHSLSRCPFNEHLDWK